MSDAFVHPKLRVANMDSYLVRSSIFCALEAALPFLKGTLLDVGCGQMPYRDYVTENAEIEKYIGMDLVDPAHYEFSVDLRWDGQKIPLENDSIDAVLLTEVLEHSPQPEDLLSEIHRVLRPGGTLFFTVPFFWPLHDVPYDEFRYTPYALTRMMNNTGFENADIHALGGWDSALAIMLGLYVRRRPMARKLRPILSYFAFPFVYYIARRVVPEMKKIRFDRDTKTTQIPEKFPKNTMITGLSGVAFK